jgi:hypothetical protein
MIISKENKAFLCEASDEFVNLIEKGNVRDLLIELNALIVSKGMNKDYKLTPYGNRAQKIYEEIYCDN